MLIVSKKVGGNLSIGKRQDRKYVFIWTLSKWEEVETLAQMICGTSLVNINNY